MDSCVKFQAARRQLETIQLLLQDEIRRLEDIEKQSRRVVDAGQLETVSGHSVPSGVKNKYTVFLTSLPSDMIPLNMHETVKTLDVEMRSCQEQIAILQMLEDHELKTMEQSIQDEQKLKEKSTFGSSKTHTAKVLFQQHRPPSGAISSELSNLLGRSSSPQPDFSQFLGSPPPRTQVRAMRSQSPHPPPIPSTHNGEVVTSINEMISPRRFHALPGVFPVIEPCRALSCGVQAEEEVVLGDDEEVQCMLLTESPYNEIISSLHEQITMLQKELDTAQTRISHLRDTHVAVAAEKATVSDKVQELEDALHDERINVREMSAKVNVQESQIQSLSEHVGELRAERDQLLERVAHMEDVRQRQTDENTESASTLKRQLQRVEDIRTYLEESKKKLEHDVAHLDDELSSVKTHSKKLEAENERLKAELSVAQRNSNLQANLRARAETDLSCTKQFQQCEFDRYEKELAAVRSAMLARDDEIGNLKKENDALRVLKRSPSATLNNSAQNGGGSAAMTPTSSSSSLRNPFLQRTTSLKSNTTS